MNTQSKTIELGVVEQQIVLKTSEAAVPGILWSSEPPTGPRPTIVIGHGGGAHKRMPDVLNLGPSSPWAEVWIPSGDGAVARRSS
jgi:hypothetical protein